MPPATRDEVTVTAGTPRHASRGRGVRVRPSTFHLGDALVMAAAGMSSGALVWLVYSQVLGDAGVAGFVIWWYAAFLLTYWLAVRELRGSLLARDAVMTVVIASAALGMLVPLLMIIVYVLSQGIGVITAHFFVQTSELCGDLQPATCGGISQAIIGTLEQMLLAMLIAVPLAVLCAVFLNEVRGRLVRPVQLFVDAMSGVPSIVAGLFVFAVWVVGLNRGFSGFAAALALSILMLPTVTRTSLEVLRLVPDGLREGALALGASQWRTVWTVVLPTARSGLITAVVLGVARAVGEAAPLQMTAFGSSSNNLNPFSGPQESLPHYVFEYLRFTANGSSVQRAYGAAAALTVLVLAMFTLARLVSARVSVESRQRRAQRKAP